MTYQNGKSFLRRDRSMENAFPFCKIITSPYVRNPFHPLIHISYGETLGPISHLQSYLMVSDTPLSENQCVVRRNIGSQPFLRWPELESLGTHYRLSKDTFIHLTVENIDQVLPRVRLRDARDARNISKTEMFRESRNLSLIIRMIQETSYFGTKTNILHFKYIVDGDITLFWSIFRKQIRIFFA